MKLHPSLYLALMLAGLGCGGSGLGANVRADVTARMQTVEDPIAACYEAALKRNRKLRGDMELRFEAEPETGKFVNVTITRNDLGDAELDRCVVDKVSALALEKPQKTKLSVTYPVRFAPEE